MKPEYSETEFSGSILRCIHFRPAGFPIAGNFHSLKL